MVPLTVHVSRRNPSDITVTKPKDGLIPEASDMFHILSLLDIP
jgi:hypothetical protein